MTVDKDKILHQNRTKNLLVEYNKLKDSYSSVSNVEYLESAAKAYQDNYVNESLTFIIENSRLIFSEPKFGFHFYKETVTSPFMTYFTSLPGELEKVSSYYNENGKNMPPEQKEEFTSLINVLESTIKSHEKTIMILNHGLETDEDFNHYYTECVNSIFNIQRENCDIEKEKAIMYEAVKDSQSPELFFAIAPYIPVNTDLRKIDANHLVASNMHHYFTECVLDEEHPSIDQREWDAFIESVVIVSNLIHDSAYKDAVNNLRIVNRTMLNGIAQESVKDQVEELYVEHVVESASNTKMNPLNTKSFEDLYSTPQGAVNKLFTDSFLYEMNREENVNEAAYRDDLADDARCILLEYVEYEYYHCEDVNQPIQGYNYFPEGTTVEQAFLMLSEAVHGKTGTPNPLLVKNHSGNPDDTIKKHGTSMREEDTGKKSKDLSDEDDDKIPEKPKPKNLANKVQFAAQDAEVKQMKRNAVLKQKGQEVGNAVKAVTNIPGNVVKNIKDMGKKWSDADEVKRKEYMLEPGFRSKAFRNLKLALMYGAVASYKITMLPVLMILRHFSKTKDVRIRRELARELDTEIKICDEKISDANAAGDQKEKYRLMRIKSQLEQEALRVKSNSRLI